MKYPLYCNVRVAEEELEGSMEFCRLRLEGLIPGVEFLGRRQLAPCPPVRWLGERCKLRAWGRAPADQQFFCTLRSPYVIKGKQLQKSLNLSARGIAPPPGGQKLHEQGGYQL